MVIERLLRQIMIKFFLIILLFPWLCFADDQLEFTKLLNNMQTLQGSFTQKVIDNKNNIIQDVQGSFLFKKPNFGLLGLNPHNYYSLKKLKIKKKIDNSLKTLKRKKISIRGAMSPDTSFVVFKKYKLDVLVGMYHDQVLGPFKALYNFKAINITLGLPYIRVSPDHGVGKEIVGKKIANPDSLIAAINLAYQMSINNQDG